MLLLAFIVVLRVAGDEPRKSGLKSKGLFFQEKEKRLSECETKCCARSESHVPCFQERVGTKHPGYMIPDRLPWRHRARPSATLHEIQVHFPINIEEWTCSDNATKCRARRQGETRSGVLAGLLARSYWVMKRKQRPLGKTRNDFIYNGKAVAGGSPFRAIF